MIMSTTLYANDSINLTTGRVTRSNPSHTYQDQIVARATQLYRETPSARIYRDSVKRVHNQNDTRALGYVIQNGGI